VGTWVASGAGLSYVGGRALEGVLLLVGLLHPCCCDSDLGGVVRD